jgi:hypothetical protein
VHFNILFTTNTVPVYHWNKCVKKIVNLSPLDGCRLNVFKATLRIAFESEIDGATFRLYTLPHNYEDVDQRKEIQTDQELHTVLESFLDLEHIPPLVLVWNNAVGAKKSPDALPALVKNTEKDTVGTRDTETADASKLRDNNTCMFCGYSQSGSFGLEACHLFEWKNWKTIAKANRFVELQKVGLVYIHEIPNLITLCLRCHNYFDGPHYMLGIHPIQCTLVVGKAVRDLETPNKNIFPTYSTLHGKKIVFNGEITHQPPVKLLIYRYAFFESKQVELVANQARGGKKKDHIRLYYCLCCLFETRDQMQLQGEISCITCSAQKLSLK